jgi:thiol-disulfide isomerase/thioredoxin
MKRVVFGVAAGALALLAACAPASRTPAPDIGLRTLDGAAAASLTTFKGDVQIVIFWKSDCAPCRAKLANVRALEAAAAPGVLVTVAVEPQASAAPAAAQMQLNPARSFVAAGDPGAVLALASEGGQVVPYSIAIDKNGQICARHRGLLGTNRIKEWVAACSV